MRATNAPRFSALRDHADGGILSSFRGCATVAVLVSKKFFRPAQRVEATITISAGKRPLRGW